MTDYDVIMPGGPAAVDVEAGLPGPAGPPGPSGPQGPAARTATPGRQRSSWGHSPTGRPADLPADGFIPAGWDGPGNPENDVQIELGWSLIYTPDGSLWTFVSRGPAPAGRGSTPAYSKRRPARPARPGSPGSPGIQGPAGPQGARGEGWRARSARTDRPAGRDRIRGRPRPVRPARTDRPARPLRAARSGRVGDDHHRAIRRVQDTRRTAPGRIPAGRLGSGRRPRLSDEDRRGAALSP